MALKIKGDSLTSFPEHGWGIVGERLGDASSEILGMVLPLDKKETADMLRGSFDESKLGDMSWFTIRASLSDVHVEESGAAVASYFEASDLTHPG